MNATKRVKRKARAVFRLCLVNGALDESRVRIVAQRLAASNRRGALAILTEVQRLVRLDRGRHTAWVESAMPLTEHERDDIRAGLTRLYGQALDTSFGQNPALIGGVRITVGSDVYDGSVRGRLAALAGRF